MAPGVTSVPTLGVTTVGGGTVEGAGVVTVTVGDGGGTGVVTVTVGDGGGTGVVTVTVGGGGVLMAGVTTVGAGGVLMPGVTTVGGAGGVSNNAAGTGPLRIAFAGLGGIPPIPVNRLPSGESVTVVPPEFPIPPLISNLLPLHVHGALLPVAMPPNTMVPSALFIDSYEPYIG